MTGVMVARVQSSRPAPARPGRLALLRRRLGRSAAAEHALAAAIGLGLTLFQQLR